MNIEPSQVTVFEKLQNVATAHNIPMYVVGGYVRDLLMGKRVSDKDVDVVVEGDGIAFANKCIHEIGGVLKTFPAFGTAKIIKPSTLPGVDEVDIATARKEEYVSPGALPKVTFATLDADLERRDFSINAMALPVSSLLSSFQNASEEWVSAVIDQFGGKEDLQNRIIRVLHPRSFLDDPTRLYRAIRYLVRIDGRFVPCTSTLFSDSVKACSLDSISVFRKCSEVRKLWEEDAAEKALTLAYDAKLLDFLGIGEDSLIIVKKMLSASIKPPFDAFIRQVLLLKSDSDRTTFAREIQLSNKKLKELLCSSPQ